MRRAWLAVIAVLLLGISACGFETKTEASPQGTSGSRMKPLVDQFKDARAAAHSDFERGALDRAIASGKIDAKDYEEAFSRYRQCAEDAKLGETYTKLPNGIYRVNPPQNLPPDSVDKYAATMKDCAVNAGLASLEALYRTQMDNPELLADPRLVTVRCLVKAGLVPADYTVEKLAAFLKTDMTSKTDFDPMAEEAQKCLNAGGIAVRVNDQQKGGG